MLVLAIFLALLASSSSFLKTGRHTSVLRTGDWRQTGLSATTWKLANAVGAVKDSLNTAKDFTATVVGDAKGRYLPARPPTLDVADLLPLYLVDRFASVPATRRPSSLVAQKQPFEVTSATYREMLPIVVELFLAASLSVLTQSLEPLSVMAELEAAFLVYCMMLSGLWLQQPVPHDDWKHDRSWDKTWNLAMQSVPDAREWFKSWFLNSSLKFEDISHDDAAEFLAWAMFSSSSTTQLADKQRREVYAAVAQIETFTGHQFRQREPGAKPLKAMRSTIEPLRHFHKPLLFYVVTQGLFGICLSSQFKKIGFEEHILGDFRYFRKPAAQASSSSSSTITTTSPSPSSLAPIIFWHGVGGLPAYLPFVEGLSLLGRDVIAVEMSYVSLHVAPNVPSIDEHSAFFDQVLQRHGYSGKAIVIGHSWGTNVCTWLVKTAPERIHTAIFLDPVNFMLHLRDITYSWFYKGRLDRETGKKDEEEHPEPPVISIASVVSLVKTERFVVHALQRPLVWFRNSLFAEELEEMGVESLVVVSTDDHIVPHKEVTRHVTSHRRAIADKGQTSCVDVKALEGADHGGLVFEESFRSQALELVKEAVNRGAVKAGEKLPIPLPLPLDSSLLTSPRNKVLLSTK